MPTNTACHSQLMYGFNQTQHPHQVHRSLSIFEWYYTHCWTTHIAITMDLFPSLSGTTHIAGLHTLLDYTHCSHHRSISIFEWYYTHCSHHRSLSIFEWYYTHCWTTHIALTIDLFPSLSGTTHIAGLHTLLSP